VSARDDAPRFDEVVQVELDDASRIDLVLHSNAAGLLFAWHSPLERGPVHCELCETPGTRVYLRAPSV